MSAIDVLWEARRKAHLHHERPICWLVSSELYYRLMTEQDHGTYVFHPPGELTHIFGIPARRVPGNEPTFALVTADRPSWSATWDGT